MSNALLILAAMVIAVAVLLRLQPIAATRALIGFARRLFGLRTRSVRVAGEDWPYLEAGPASAPVMLFVHGYGADKDMWLSYARLFTRRYRIIAPDLPGFGDAALETERDYRPRTQAHRLAAFCDALRIKDAHVVGSSMGGFISAWLAVDRADLVCTLTLMNAAGVYGSEPSLVQSAAESGQNPLIAVDDASLQRVLDLLSCKSMWLPRFARVFLVARYRERQALLDEIFWQLVEAHESEGLEAALGRIRAPTLVLWGDSDQVLDPSCADVFERGIPGARRVLLDNVGHIPMYEAPRLAAAAQRALISARD